jgi:2-isopropylmalate synthase
MKRVKFFDTTLRDGEQAPGNTLSVEQKLQVALALESLGVDTIEAGFPVSSEVDYQATQLISERIKESSICALARTEKEDIDKAAVALHNAEDPRLHLFIATSSIHMEHKLQLSPNQVLDRIKDSITYAKRKINNITFSPEDATRSDYNFLVSAIGLAIESGATTVNIPDTVGFGVPEQYGHLLWKLTETYEGQITFSTHSHNDLGLATANTLSGIRNGALEVQVTINGIGERAGNASLEEVAAALHTRKDYFEREFNIDLQRIYETSELVYQILGRKPSHEKAIVGVNAFRHEAGIHQNGLEKEPTTYEIIDPRLIGRERELVYGRHSGREVCRKLGIDK